MDFSVSDSELLLDNASIHLSATTRHFTKRLEMQMRFLTPYSPKLAPVEIVFGMLKNKLRAKKSQHVIRYSMISGRKEICQALSEFTKTKASRLWSVFVYEAKKIILSWREYEFMVLGNQIKEKKQLNE